MRGEKFKVQKREDGCTAGVHSPHTFCLMLKKNSLRMDFFSHRNTMKRLRVRKVTSALNTMAHNL